MNCGISALFCCMRPNPTIVFQHSKVEFSGKKAYVDVFCQVDGTFIHDNDYLCVSKPPHLNSSDRIFIMKEPGEMSGVARVTFPNDSGTYVVSYIRTTSHHITILGELVIVVPARIRRKSTGHTFDTENYSPRFIQSIVKRNTFEVLQSSIKPYEIDSEMTQNGDKILI